MIDSHLGNLVYNVIVSFIGPMRGWENDLHLTMCYKTGHVCKN